MIVNQKKPLVIDASVISHALSKKQTSAYAALFNELEASYQFIVTGYTRFELLRSSDSKNRVKYGEYIEQDMFCIELSRVLMDFSARLNFVYKNFATTKGKVISDGDVINAALAIIKSCPVLTHDSLDYPAPFFKEVGRHDIRYESKNNRDVIDLVYVQSPDLEYIKYCFDQHGG